MGRCLKQFDRDYMKMAMLKQEEIFRQQVHELHHLYRVQKLLMRDMKAELKRQRNNKSFSNQRRPSRILDLEVLPAEDCIPNDDHSTNLKAEEEEEEEEDEDLELTLAIGSNKSCRRKKESSFTSDSGVSFSSSSTESGGVQLNGNQWGLFSYRTEEKMKMQQQPPWLLQCLSLNMA